MTDTLLDRPNESTAAPRHGDEPATHEDVAARSARRSTTRRKWRSRVIVVAMVIIAAAAAVGLARYQSAKSVQLKLGELVLTSQPIPVETSLPGLVTAVGVRAGQHVAKGQLLGTIQVTTTNSSGHAVLAERRLLAPRTGIVVDDPMTLGATLQPGTPFVVLYDPQALTLVADVPLTDVSQVAPGMTATLTAPGVAGSIRATLVRAIPRVGTAESDVTTGQLQLVFRPVDRAKAARLIPGMRFTGSVDTTTGRRGTRHAEFVN